MMKNTNNLNTDTMTRYNGWTNYETWRVNLEMLDGMTVEDFGMCITDDHDRAIAALSQHLEEYVWEMVDHVAADAIGSELSYLAKVDWQDIAEHMWEDAQRARDVDTKLYYAEWLFQNPLDQERTEQANTKYNTA